MDDHRTAFTNQVAAPEDHFYTDGTVRREDLEIVHTERVRGKIMIEQILAPATLAAVPP